MYFKISNSDGDTLIQTFEDKNELLKELKENEPNCLINVTNMDTNYWGENSVLIIKGTIVMPTVKKVIEELDIE